MTAVKAANLTAALAMPNGPYTVFAPNNDAFAKLPAGELAYLLAHPAELAAIIEYHLGDRRLYADEIIQLGRLRSITGEELVTIIDATGNVLINGYSKVIAANAADCTNGVVVSFVARLLTSDLWWHVCARLRLRISFVSTFMEESRRRGSLRGTERIKKVRAPNLAATVLSRSSLLSASASSSFNSTSWIPVRDHHAAPVALLSGCQYAPSESCRRVRPAA